MSKLMKRVMALAMVIGMAVGIVGVPQIGEAGFSYGSPSATLYVELVNKQGENFSKPLMIDANLLYFNIHLSTGGSAPISAPINITKVGGRNVFALEIPAFTGTANHLNIFELYQVLSDIRITSPVPSVTSIDVYSGQYTADIYRQYAGGWSSVPMSVSTSKLFPTRNIDGTWNLFLNRVAILGRPGEYYSEFGKRVVIETKLGEGAFNILGKDGNTIKLRLVTPQIEEVFEDETGAIITAPTGYTNNKYTDVTDQPQSYQMLNDSSLPQTYADASFFYTYKGWYKGAGNQGSMVTMYPPSISFNAGLIDAQNEVHIVYNKKALRIVNEKFIDTNSASIDSSWDNLGQTFVDGETFTGNPATNKTDSSGTDWEYKGWKFSTEPMSALRTTAVSHVINANTTIQYIYKKKERTVTEKWVDQADGSTLVPMAGNTKTNTVDDNDNFTGTAAATITDSSGEIWDYFGWENVTDDPGNVNPSPAYAVNNVKGDKEIRYHYQARKTTATLDLKPTPQIVDSGDTVSWSSKLTNTGGSDLKDLVLKSTSNWAAGLTDPVKVTVTPAGGAPQDFTVNSGDWATGVNLTGISIPKTGPNNYADITFTTTATGAVNQVLPAEIEVDGNIPTPLKAENFVRIDDPDEPNLLPSGNSGLLNIPNFKFGEVEVKPFAQRKGLDSSEYSNPSYNPYIRYMDNESIGTYSLSVKMGPFTSGSKTLPAATSIILGTGTVKEVQNYNKPNETLSAGSSIGPMRIESDNTTSIIHLGNTQGVYQIDYDFNDVELDLVAHSGIAGLSYTADMDWTLTTAP